MKTKKTKEEPQNPTPVIEAERSKPERREVLIGFKGPLRAWLEARATERGEEHLQPTINEKLRRQFESEQQAPPA